MTWAKVKRELMTLRPGDRLDVTLDHRPAVSDIKRNAVEYLELWQRDYRFGPQGAPGSVPRAPNSPLVGKPQ